MMRPAHRLRYSAAAAIAAVTLALGGCAASGDAPRGAADGETTGTLKLGHGGAPGDVLTQSVDMLNELIQEGTDGRWSVENYGASQLGNERDLVEGVSMGTVDMTLVTNAPLGNFVPEALFYDLPGLYQDLDHVHAVAESSLIDEHLAPALLEKDLRLLGITDGGFRNITNSRGPIETLDDLQGLKMRVQESPMIMATYGAIPGVSPVPVPIGDLYTSLDQGIVDAQENPAILVRDFKFYEVQDYMTLTQHSYFPRHFLINETVWNSLSADDQKVFQDAIDEVITFKNGYYESENQNALDALEVEGMSINEPREHFAADLSELMRAEVYPQFYQDIGGGDPKKGEQIIQQIIDLGK